MFVMSLLIAFTGSLLAQTRKVSGKITSDKDGAPIENVSVRLVGAIMGTTSNAQGEYSIDIDAKSTETLNFSHPDFDPLQISVTGKSEMNLILTSNVRYNQYGQRVDRLQLQTEAREGILTFESKDKSFKLWTDMRLNIDFTKFFDNYDNSLSFNHPDNANAIQLSDGAHIRRARIAFKAQVTDKWYGEVDLDFRDAEIDINDVYLEYVANENFSIKVGQFREPFGMMVNTTSRYVTFMERPMNTEMDPSRHIGIGAKYSHPRFFSGIGVFTDEALELATKDVRRKLRYGTEASKAITGRIMGYPVNKDDFTLGIGFSGSYRTPMITDEGLNTVRIRANPENRTSQKRFLDTDAVKNVKNIIIANAELAFAYKSFRLQSEYKMMTLDRGPIFTDINYTGQNLNDAKFSGYYVEVSYFLTGDKQNFNYADGEFTRVKPKSDKGAVELALRYSTLDLNSDEAAVFGGYGAISAIGLTWWAKTNVRIILNGAYVDHDEHASTKYKWPVPAEGFDFFWIGTRFEIDF